MQGLVAKQPLKCIGFSAALQMEGGLENLQAMREQPWIKQYVAKQQRWLLFLRHCAKCEAPEELDWGPLHVRQGAVAPHGHLRGDPLPVPQVSGCCAPQSSSDCALSAVLCLGLVVVVCWLQQGLPLICLCAFPM